MDEDSERRSSCFEDGLKMASFQLGLHINEAIDRLWTAEVPRPELRDPFGPD
jgi:hypothetical protein